MEAVTSCARSIRWAGISIKNCWKDVQAREARKSQPHWGGAGSHRVPAGSPLLGVEASKCTEMKDGFCASLVRLWKSTDEVQGQAR